jgi:type II secretory pathway component GspD/PulD (secretin)
MAGCGLIEPVESPAVAGRRTGGEGQGFRKLLEAAGPGSGTARRTLVSADRPVSISAQGMQLREFLRYLADRTGVSVVAAEGLDTKEVTLDVTEQPVGQVLSTVARRLGVDLTRTGEVYFLGQLKPEDRGVLVRVVRRMTGEDLQKALDTLRSEHGKGVAFADGVCVVSDTVEVLARVTELLDGVEAAPAVTWVVQLYVVSVAESRMKDLGLDITPLADLSVKVALGSVASAVSSDVNLKLNAVLQAARENKGMRMECEPLLLCSVGREATVTKGNEVPIVQHAISDQGTNTIAGVTYKQTGLQIAASVIEVGAERARLTLKVQLADQAGTVEGYPILASQSVSVSPVVQSGGVYLVAALNRSDAAHEEATLLPTRAAETRSAELLQVWARVYRLGTAAVVEDKE